MQNLAVSRFRISLLLSLVCVLSQRSVADDWPQWRGVARDGVWNESGLIERFDSKQIPIKWSVDIAPGYSGPTVAKGRVYITDRLNDPKQIERVHCFAEADGEHLWTHDYDCEYIDVGYMAGPRAAVTIDSGVAFSLGTMGNLFALDAATGEVKWDRDLNKDFKIKMPGWGIASAPLVYGDLLVLQIGGADGACMVALNKETGEEAWRALDDKASYSAPIVIRQGGKDVLVCWTGDNVAGLEPSTGKVFWKSRMKPTRAVIGIATPVVEKGLIFVTSFYDGSKMVEYDPDSPTAKELWRSIGPDEKNTQALHSIISTPLMIDGYIYGVDSYGELRCLDAKTGERIWEDRTATPRNRWSNIHMVRNGSNIWMFNEAGELLIGRVSPKGFTEISRAKLIEPTKDQLGRRDGVCWAHPAYANGHVFVRNDKRLVCADLRKK